MKREISAILVDMHGLWPRLELGSNPVLLCASSVVLNKSFRSLNFIFLICKNGGDNTCHEGVVVERTGDDAHV